MDPYLLNTIRIRSSIPKQFWIRILLRVLRLKISFHFRAQKSLDFQGPPLPMAFEIGFSPIKIITPRAIYVNIRYIKSKSQYYVDSLLDVVYTEKPNCHNIPKCVHPRFPPPS